MMKPKRSGRPTLAQSKMDVLRNFISLQSYSPNSLRSTSKSSRRNKQKMPRRMKRKMAELARPLLRLLKKEGRSVRDSTEKKVSPICQSMIVMKKRNR